MSEAEPTAKCEACAKASEEWLKGDYPETNSSVAALMDANQRTHHAEIAALCAELKKVRGERDRLLSTASDYSRLDLYSHQRALMEDEP